MLVLSRKRDEDIVIMEGDTKITIKVVEIVGDKVRLGFVAPNNVTIMRKELLAQKEDTKNGLERPAAGGPLCSFF